MKRISAKRRKREAECREFRLQLKLELGHCELCDMAARKRWNEQALHVHEIARGASRQAALDQRCAVLVLCADCHLQIIHGESWLESRQLLVLKRSRPDDYDLAAYNAIKGFGPGRISEADVERWR